MNRIPLKTLILSAFVILLSTMAITNLQGLSALSDINGRLNTLVDNAMKQVQITSDIRQGMQAISRDEKNTILALTQEEMDVFANNINDNLSQIEGLQKQLDPLVSEAVRKDLAQFDQTWDQYVAVNKEVRSLARENSNTKAAELSKTKVKDSFDKANKTIYNLVERLQARMNTSNDLTTLRATNVIQIIAADIQLALLEIQRDEKNTILVTTDEEMQAFEKVVQATKVKIEENLNQLENLVLESDKPLLFQFKRELEQFYTGHQQVKDLSLANTNVEAFNLASNKGRLLL